MRERKRDFDGLTNLHVIENDGKGVRMILPLDLSHLCSKMSRSWREFVGVLGGVFGPRGRERRESESERDCEVLGIY